MWSDDRAGSAPAHHGAVPGVAAPATENGRPPSSSVADASQSQSAGARSLVAGAASASTSKACRAPAGWLLGARRSASSAQPKPPSALR